MSALTGYTVAVGTTDAARGQGNRRAVHTAAAFFSERNARGVWGNYRLLLLATPLFLALILVEITDVVFAVDSIPAIFATTTDSFIVFTSNIFAILGLRSLFFLPAGFIDRFRYLQIGLASVLLFVGVKMALVDFYKLPPLVSLAVITLLLGGSTAASLLASHQGEDKVLSC